MKIGFAAVDLPVPPGVAMGGYTHRHGTVAGVLDPLRVTALTWHDGHRRAALVLADVICVNTDLVHAARAAVSGVDLLWLAASHTHAGPETGCVPGGGPTPRPWLDRVVAAAAAAVDHATAAEADAEGRAYHGILRDVGAIRSQAVADPAVPLDVVEVVAGGRRSGVLVVLPVHPTVLPEGNLLISADLVGAVRKALSARLGAGVWVAVATGAAGDISTRHTRRAKDRAELSRLGGLVADGCADLLTAPPVPAWSPGSRLAWRTRTIRLAPKPPPDNGPALVAAAAAALAAAREGADPVAVRIAEGNLQGTRLAAARPAPAGEIEAEVAALRIGRLTLAALPGEPFLALAEAVRHARAEPTAILGYANGYPGYLPTTAAYRTGGYEALAAAAAQGSGERIARLTTDLITELDGATT